MILGAIAGLLALVGAVIGIASAVNDIATDTLDDLSARDLRSNLKNCHKERDEALDTLAKVMAKLKELETEAKKCKEWEKAFRDLLIVVQNQGKVITKFQTLYLIEKEKCRRQSVVTKPSCPPPPKCPECPKCPKCPETPKRRSVTTYPSGSGGKPPILTVPQSGSTALHVYSGGNTHRAY